MGYFTNRDELRQVGVDFNEVIDPDQPRGCVEPELAYGAAPGVITFEEAESQNIIKRIPEDDWQLWLEDLEKSRGTLQHRVDESWERALTQGRSGYCWSYAVIGAMQACDARDGLSHIPYSAASVAAQIKGGRDQGGWPVDAATFIETNGVCKRESWNDCSCSGGRCKGPRGGCQARDLSLVESTREEAAQHKVRTFVELPRKDMSAYISALLQGLPVAGGWVGTGAWCDGHAMFMSRPVRDSRRGWGALPDNSWGDYKRRTPVWKAPLGGVVVVHTTRTVE